MGEFTGVLAESGRRRRRPRGRPFGFAALSGFVLAVVLAGLVVRVDPYLDLLRILVVVLVLFLALGRARNQRLKLDLADRETRARSIRLELAELSAIFEVSSRANSFRTVDEALQFIAHSARECLSADRASVMLLDGRELVVKATAGGEGRGDAGRRAPLGEGVAGWVAAHRRPLLLNARRDLEAFFREGAPDRTASALCVPLHLEGESIGVLNVSRHAGTGRAPFLDRHLKLLTIFADYAATTIRNLATYRELADAHGRLEKSYRELRQVQDQLVHSEKMSTIGQLISEVAHELNNPLTTTVGYADLLARLNRDPEMASHLAKIRSEGIRCQAIIRNLLDFARKTRGERAAVDLNDVVRKTLDLRRYQLRIVGIELETDLAENLPSFLADPVRLQQVLLNLVNNAAQAIEEGGGKGRIRVETRHEEAEREVLIRVTDDGPGIPDALRTQVFEPFFTTKPAGKGTGLGLSVCRGIVEEHGGRISVAEAPGGGAEFRIALPLFPVEAATAAGGPEDGPVPRRSLRVLVVDDDAEVLRLIQRALQLDRHRVEVAESVDEALDRIRREPYDLVLTDLVMPGGTGLALHRTLAAEAPELAVRVVFFSGAVGCEEVRHEVEATGRVLLSKPFRLEELRAAMHRTLAPETTLETTTAAP